MRTNFLVSPAEKTLQHWYESWMPGINDILRKSNILYIYIWQNCRIIKIKKKKNLSSILSSSSYIKRNEDDTFSYYNILSFSFSFFFWHNMIMCENMYICNVARSVMGRVWCHKIIKDENDDNQMKCFINIWCDKMLKYIT